MHKPLVTVIIPHQLSINEPYLNLCMKAVQRSTYENIEVIVIDGSPTKPTIPAGFGVLRSEDLNTATKKFHTGISIASPKSEYFLFLSDDVVISEYMIEDMVSAFSGREFIMNPMSNSDCTSMYEADIILKNVAGTKRLHPDMKMEDLKGWEKEVIEFPRRPKCLIPFQTLSFYCTMIPRSVWNKVGELDPALESRHNDQDYCLRAHQLNIPSVVNMGCFAFHFGSRTLMHVADQQTRQKCTEHFVKKWNMKIQHMRGEAK
jgi:hypothetical protein